MMRVTMTQHAVGQGGFFCASIKAGAAPFRWAYDCGSNQPAALAREIQVVANDGPIDILFLSHLDSDHVSGIDKLLQQTQVHQVVLPYLNAETLIATLARDDARGVLNTSFIEAASDLSGWFGERGVETVTFVDGGDDGEGGADGPFLPGGPEDGGEGEITGKWTVPATPIAPDTDETRGQLNLAGGARLQRVTMQSAMSLITPHAVLNWALIPQAHLPPKRLMDAFRDALEAAFGSPLNLKAVVDAVRDPTDREKLRDCYDALWLDHNLVSMSLYCGPITPLSGRLFVTSDQAPHLHRRYHEPLGEFGGWMLTGDAHLDGKRRRAQFLRHYAHVVPYTNLLMVPHHGSIHNHSPILINAFPALHIAYAACGPNSYGHPHKAVSDDVEAHPVARWHEVNDYRYTQLVVRVVPG